MATWKGMTAEELLVKREIDRVNRQIRQAAQTFGTDSPLYKHYLTLIAPDSKISFGHDMVRETKQGVIQLSVSRRAVTEMMTYSQYSKRLQRLSNQPTVREAKQQFVKAYEEHFQTELKTRKEREAAIQETLSKAKGLFEDINELLADYYKLERKTGHKYVGYAEAKKLSGGYWTSVQDLELMKEKLQKVLNQQDKRIVKNVVEGY